MFCVLKSVLVERGFSTVCVSHFKTIGTLLPIIMFAVLCAMFAECVAGCRRAHFCLLFDTRRVLIYSYKESNSTSFCYTELIL